MISYNLVENGNYGNCVPVRQLSAKEIAAVSHAGGFGPNNDEGTARIEREASRMAALTAQVSCQIFPQMRATFSEIIVRRFPVEREKTPAFSRQAYFCILRTNKF